MHSQAQLSNFLRQWRALYRSKPSLEFDPEWLWTMYRAYWGFLTQILGANHELLACNKKQWTILEKTVKKPETLDHRSRRGGKTLKLSHMLVFFSELGFGAGSLAGKVIYRCPFDNQIKGLRQWLKKNPFFVKDRRQVGEIDLLDHIEPLDVSLLSEGKTTGLECAVLVEDEYSTIPKGTVMEGHAKQARAFLAKGATETKRHIHASSGRVNTVFEDDYHFLYEFDPDACISMPWWECPWITQDYIEKERARNFDAAYFIEEQFECKWVCATGQFFDQSKLHIIGQTCTDEFIRSHGIKPTSAGIDFNGASVGHICYEVCWDQDHTIYVFKERIFQHVREIADYIRANPMINVEVEGCESGRGGGYNAGFADHLQEYEVRCSYQDWTEENVKRHRLALLQKCDVVVYPDCKWFLKNFKESTFDPKGDTDGRPKLLKTADQHGLDAVLHALATGGTIDFAQFQQIETQQYQDLIDMVRTRSRVY